MDENTPAQPAAPPSRAPHPPAPHPPGPRLSAADQQLWIQSEAHAWAELMHGARPLPPELDSWTRVGPGTFRRGALRIRLQHRDESVHCTLIPESHARSGWASGPESSPESSPESNPESSTDNSTYQRLGLGHLSWEARRLHLDRRSRSGWRRWLGWLAVHVDDTRIPRAPFTAEAALITALQILGEPDDPI